MVSPAAKAWLIASCVTSAAFCESAGPMPDQWNHSASAKIDFQSKSEAVAVEKEESARS